METKSTNNLDIGNMMFLTMTLLPLIEYDEYISIVCTETERDKLALMKERGLSLGLSASHMKDYLQMKHHFKEWFLYTLIESERQLFIDYVKDNMEVLMKRSIDILEHAQQSRFVSILLTRQLYSNTGNMFA